MESEANHLRSDLRRFAYLRPWVTDPRTIEALTQLTGETEERLRTIEGEKALLAPSSWPRR